MRNFKHKTCSIKPKSIPASSTSKVVAEASFPIITAIQSDSPAPWYHKAQAVLKKKGKKKIKQKLDNNSGIHKCILMMTPCHQRHRQQRQPSWYDLLSKAITLMPPRGGNEKRFTISFELMLINEQNATRPWPRP